MIFDRAILRGAENLLQRSAGSAEEGVGAVYMAEAGRSSCCTPPRRQGRLIGLSIYRVMIGMASAGMRR